MNYILDIGIPCFNESKYLKRCIQSIVNCFKGYYDKIQIWVIDDDSMYGKEYLQIIKDFNFLNFTYIKNEINSGPGQSRNKVFELGQAEWIIFIDDDDIFIKNPIPFIDNDKDFILFNLTNQKGSFISDTEEIFGYITGSLYKASFIKENKIYFPKILKFNGEDSFFRLLLFGISKNYSSYNKASIITHIIRKDSNFSLLSPTMGENMFDIFNLKSIINFYPIYLFYNQLNKEIILKFLDSYAQSYFNFIKKIKRKNIILTKEEKFNLSIFLLLFYNYCDKYILNEINDNKKIFIIYNFMKNNLTISNNEYIFKNSFFSNDNINSFFPIDNFSLDLNKWINNYFTIGEYNILVTQQRIKNGLDKKYII